MSFEYNGFIHRDLEPQVRYDAEQVQLLKQADVTINENLQSVNENLQTINTELNGKLTKPTNPSAESAVTMLADGTVGTKPLSEIGGGGSGGGKLYKHTIRFTAFGVSEVNSGLDIILQVERYSSSSTPLTTSNFQTLFPVNIPVLGTSSISNGDAICTIRCVPSGQILKAILYYPTTTPSGTAQTGSGLMQGIDLTKITESSNPPAHPISFSDDTVTEL